MSSTALSNSTEAKKLVSVVVPVYNNAPTLETLFRKFEDTARADPLWDFEFIFVDDRSEDDSYSILRGYLKISSYKVKILRLSKNHGSFTSSLAGLTKAQGDCAVIISADLQDPPELISQMVREWSYGHEVVMAERRSRGDPFLTRLSAKIFYALFRKFALKDMPRTGFDFVLFDRKVINILCEIKEKNTSLMGLILWSGFSRRIISYDRKPRTEGKSRWTFRKKLKYFVDSFVAFSFAPMRFSSIAGFTVSLLGFLYLIVIIIDRLVNRNRIRGITTLIALVLILGGMQLIILGIIGEYLWRILDEVRNRPTFIIDEFKQNDPVPKPPSLFGKSD
jgi:dolichol-phosphate mannosyltransferase